MSEEQMPAWAQVMEHRLIVEISKRSRIARPASRAASTIRGDTGVNMARADPAHTKIDSDRAEVASLRKEMVGLSRRLQDVEHRLFNGKPNPPGAA